MAMKASDLSSEQKSLIVKDLADHMGHAKFMELASSLGGVDRVIDAFLEKLAESKKAEGASKERFFDSLGVFLGIVIGFAMAIAGFKESGWGGAISSFIMSVFFLGPALVAALRFLPPILGGAVACIMLAAGGYALWKALTFTASGTVTWFQWLFGHF